MTDNRADVQPATHVALEFDLQGLAGISDETLEVHFRLYRGYVDNTNRLEEQIAELSKAGRRSSPEFAELVRRRAYELNGAVLHEQYFGNLVKESAGPSQDGAFAQAATRSFGSLAAWQEDFVAVAGLRGVGWAMAVQDPATGRIGNHWITLHEQGHVAGHVPLLVLDLWEHAWFLDYEPSERNDYVGAFFRHVAWNVVDSRVRDGETRLARPRSS